MSIIASFPNFLVVGQLGSGPPRGSGRVSDKSFQILSCAVVHAVVWSGFRDSPSRWNSVCPSAKWCIMARVILV